MKHASSGIHAVVTADIGTPTFAQAVRRYWEANTVLTKLEAGTGAFHEWIVRISAAHLMALQDYDNPEIAKRARLACLRFGLSKPVAVGFNLEGDRA